MVYDRIPVEDADLFREIMSKECLIKDEWKFSFFDQHRPEHIFHDAIQILEVARSSTIPRSFLKNYGLCADERIYESVSAHTNLFRVIFDRALDDFEYYANSSDEEAGARKVIADEVNRYTREEMHEAILLHDLPENDFGDWPDNGTYDRDYKHYQEHGYFSNFVQLYSRKSPEFGKRVLELTEAMNDENSFIGQLLYLADKVSAIIIALSYDRFGTSPVMHRDSPIASERDRKEMELCDYQQNGYCKASEMWTIDYLRMRKICERDRTGYYTALVVMCTIIVHRNWYAWRKNNYAEHHHKLDNP